jgi:CDP-2,3-bis-(O-geranylgeranyl)-sn-glycerol synthase
MLLAFVLLLAANGAPILSARWLGRRWDCPLDGGVRFLDGRALLGRAKTCRGVISAVVVCGVIGWLAGISLQVGVLFGIYAMLGDLVSSFVKRRLGIAPSGRAVGLDQIPESLLPLWMLQGELGLGNLEVVTLVAGFFVLELALSRLLYRWHIRSRPY